MFVVEFFSFKIEIKNLRTIKLLIKIKIGNILKSFDKYFW
jgi:hypothetical protein